MAFIGSDERFITTRDRLTGYHRAMHAVGVEPDPSWIRPGPTSDVDAATVTLEVLAQPEPPTAIFAANPRAAIGVAHALHTTGQAHVAFVSFGDFPLAQTLSPAVTYVDQDPAAIGAAAMRRVLVHLEQGVDDIADIFVPSRLVPRGSGELAPR